MGEICIRKLSLLLNSERRPADTTHPKIDEQDNIFIDKNNRSRSYKWAREILENLQAGEKDFIDTKKELEQIVNGNEFNLDVNKIRIGSITLEDQEEMNKIIPLIEWGSKTFN